MKRSNGLAAALLMLSGVLLPITGAAEIGKRFESERKVVKDPTTGMTSSS